MKPELVRALGADYSINIVALATDPDDVRETVGYVSVDIVVGEVIVTIRRIDEAKFGLARIEVI